MTTQAIRQSTASVSRPLLDKAFFGKDNCLTIQLRDGSCYFKWGKKHADAWTWKNVKFNDVELGELLRLLRQETSEAKFYHSFNEESTQIWFNRTENSLVCKAGEYVKGLNAGEQVVFAVLIERIIWMMNVV